MEAENIPRIGGESHFDQSPNRAHRIGIVLKPKCDHDEPLIYDYNNVSIQSDIDVDQKTRNPIGIDIYIHNSPFEGDWLSVLFYPNDAGEYIWDEDEEYDVIMCLRTTEIQRMHEN